MSEGLQQLLGSRQSCDLLAADKRFPFSVETEIGRFGSKMFCMDLQCAMSLTGSVGLFLIV